jgi:hypothetical protein
MAVVPPRRGGSISGMTFRSWAWTKCYDGIDIPRGAYIPTKRSCELIPAKAKAFRAEAQRRREHKENKAVIYFESPRLCVSARVQLFFHSFKPSGRMRHPPNIC